MIDLGKYSRKDILEKYKMTRFDSLQKKLKRRGYEFVVDGRGENATLTITKTPPRFREFCIEELHYDARTDFKRLKRFLYELVFNDEFRRLPFVTMKEYLIGNMEVTNVTVSKWIKHLYDENIVADGDWVYYRMPMRGDPTKNYKEISQEEYNEAWKAYFDVLYDEDGNKNGQHHLARMAMYERIGGYAYKKTDIIFNGFATERIDRLEEILRKEIDLDV